MTACGGGDSAESDETTVGNDAAPTTAAEAPSSDTTEDLMDQAESANDAANAEAEGGAASVTIDGVTIEAMSFDDALVQRCDPDFFGGFWVILASDPDPATQPDIIEMAFPGGDYTDPPFIKVTTDTGDTEWIAEEGDVPEGTPQPNIQWTVDGNTVSGTATVYEENSLFAVRGGQVDEVTTAEASFEATCPAG